MWFKLAGATFSNNLGTMDSISKSYMMDYSGLTGLSASPGSVSHATDSTPDAIITFTVKSGYVFKSGATVTASGGTTRTYTASADIAAGSTFTMALTSISGKVTFSGAAELVSSGGGSEGDDDTNSGSGSGSTTYTFTVNPTPSTATVTLSASGYTTVSGAGSKSITVASGTSVSWSVSASGYTTQSGTQSVTSTSSKSVTLSASSSSGTVALYGKARTIVSSVADMTFTAKLTLSDSGAVTNVTGRASDHTNTVAVSAGQTVTLSQPISGVTLTYALCCFNSSGILCSADKNFTARAWISSSSTLPTGTAYVMIAFKRGDGSTDFSSTELAQLPNALTIA